MGQLISCSTAETRSCWMDVAILSHGALTDWDSGYENGFSLYLCNLRFFPSWAKEAKKQKNKKKKITPDLRLVNWLTDGCCLQLKTSNPRQGLGGEEGVLPYKRLMGMCRWALDGVAFLRLD